MADTVTILSIHDLERGGLAFDLKEILTCLGDRIDGWKWYLDRELDATGVTDTTETDALYEMVERAKPHGVWISTQVLRTFAENTIQVIDGQFIAFPVAINEQTRSEQEKDTMYFARSAMECVIRAIDSSEFIIFLKSEALIENIRSCFHDIREEKRESWLCSEDEL